ncbi:MAG: hypothetical protein ACYCYK_05695 [Candidatus Dormibacteria bacterium]
MCPTEHRAGCRQEDLGVEAGGDEGTECDLNESLGVEVDEGLGREVPCDPDGVGEDVLGCAPEILTMRPTFRPANVGALREVRGKQSLGGIGVLKRNQPDPGLLDGKMRHGAGRRGDREGERLGGWWHLGGGRGVVAVDTGTRSTMAAASWRSFMVACT